MTTFSFTVIGKPQPKGAHTSFIPRRGDGTIVTRRDGAPMVVTKDTNPRQEAAQANVATVALAARQQAGARLHLGPVALVLRYWFARPANHYGTGRNLRILKDSAPAYPVTAADLDKAERLVFDGLTGVIFRDDKQVVRCFHEKAYVELDEVPHLEVEVELIDAATVAERVADAQLLLA